MSVSPPPTYPAAIEQAIAAIGEQLRGDYALSHRTLALLLLQDDPEIWDEVEAQETPAALNAIRAVKEQLEHAGETPLAWQIEQRRQQWSQQLAAQVTQATAPPRPNTLAEWVGWLCMNPWTGFPILALVLYFGLYQFVGVFGAGTVVGLIEETLFGEYINPFVEQAVRGCAVGGDSGAAGGRVRRVDAGRHLRDCAHPADCDFLLPGVRDSGGHGLFAASGDAD